MKTDSRIYLAGHSGLLGSAILRALESGGYQNVIVHSSRDLDLRDAHATASFFQETRPEYVFFAAGTVGGIMANVKYPADFIFDNLSMITNVVQSSYVNHVKKLLYFASSCVYPRDCPQPIKEEYLLTGALEETNRPYAIAKIAGLELCFSFNRQHNTDNIVLMPTNLFGLRDNYDLENSHLVAALIRKFHDAKSRSEKKVQLWGTGNPRREILSSDSVADAAIYFMKNYSGSEIVNVGCGVDFTIREIALMIQNVVGYDGEVLFDSSKPDGVMKKQLDVSRANRFGWVAKNDLLAELKIAYQDFAANYRTYCGPATGSSKP